jgi:hypothetical protein
VDDRCELVDGVETEDGILRVHEVNNIEGYDLRSHSGVLTEGHIDVNLAQSFDPLVAEAVQRVLCFLQIFFLKPMLEKHCQVNMSAELPLSTRTLPTSLPK